MNGFQKIFLFYSLLSLWIGVFAQETHVEIVFKDGTAMKGVLLNYGQRTYQVKINGQIQTFSENDIQTVRFEGSSSDTKNSSPTKESTSSVEEDSFEKILKARVTIDFQETPLGEVLDFFRNISGLNIVIMPQVDLDVSITLSARDIQFETAFALLKFFAPIKYGRRGNVLVILPESSESNENPLLPPFSVSSFKMLSEHKPELFKKLRNVIVTVDFNETPVIDILAFLRDISDINLGINPQVFQEISEEKLKVNLTLQKMELYLVLQMIESMLSLKFVIVNNEVLWLTLPELLSEPESTAFNKLLDQAKEDYKAGRFQEALSKLSRIPKNEKNYEEAALLKKQMYQEIMKKEIFELYQTGNGEEALRIIDELGDPEMEPLKVKIKRIIGFFRNIREQLDSKKPNINILQKNAESILQIEQDASNWYSQEAKKVLDKFCK